MAKYAADTSVPVESSKAEIEKLVTKYGAVDYATGWSAGQAILTFSVKELRVKFVLPLPTLADKSVGFTATGKKRSQVEAAAALAQQSRARWRAFVLVIKAKLESTDSGIRTFEQEFLSDIVTESGLTIGQIMHPQLEHVANTGKLPPLLEGPKG